MKCLLTTSVTNLQLGPRLSLARGASVLPVEASGHELSGDVVGFAPVLEPEHFGRFVVPAGGFEVAGC